MKKNLFLLFSFMLVFLFTGCKSKEDNATSKVMRNKEEFIQILLSTGRPGMESVICHLDSTGFFTMSGGGHHMKEGGLVQHSLEVYRIMKFFAWFQHSDSIAIVALFHDMGKIDKGHYHSWRSATILKEWGLEITDDEYWAIFKHHNLESKYLRIPLHRALVVSDAISTGWWKLWHRTPGKIPE